MSTIQIFIKKYYTQLCKYKLYINDNYINIVKKQTYYLEAIVC